jgi:hypothetical protein
VHLLLTELKKRYAQDERFDARVKVLGELVNPHIEEEGEMFPKVEATSMNWEELSAQGLQRKEQLRAKIGASVKNGRGKARKKT